MARTNVAIVIEETHQSQMTTMAQALEAAGLKDVSILSNLGMVTGQVDPANLECLKAISGVKVVQEIS